MVFSHFFVSMFPGYQLQISSFLFNLLSCSSSMVSFIEEFAGHPASQCSRNMIYNRKVVFKPLPKEKLSPCMKLSHNNHVKSLIILDELLRLLTYKRNPYQKITNQLIDKSFMFGNSIHKRNARYRHPVMIYLIYRPAIEKIYYTYSPILIIS